MISLRNLISVGSYLDLLKLRETLLDTQKDGVSVTEPAGISVFPNICP